MKNFYPVLFLLFFARVGLSQKTELPAPNLKRNAVKVSEVIGWPKGKTPKTPSGFKVIRWADRLTDPRWIYVGPNGDVFVAEVQGANRITILRGDAGAEKPKLRQFFLSGLNKPIGMLILTDWFFVANTDAVWRYPYKVGQTKITGKGQKIKSLPGGGKHWTRNLIANAEGTKLYVAVGSNSNVGENGMKKESRRANILEMNLDGSEERVFASGLRNPVGMGINPQTKDLWATVNERDQIGEHLVPDFLTSVKAGAFYGWPYSYFGSHPDPRLKGEGMDLVKTAVEPDVALGAYTASLGMTFYDKKQFPPHYQEGAFIGQQGSWNRGEFSGYKVSFIPFTKGYAAGEQEDFLTGFVADKNKNQVFGSPVGVAVGNDGELLVADVGAKVIWKVTAIPVAAETK